jgi:hypothetical protein
LRPIGMIGLRIARTALKVGGTTHTYRHRRLGKDIAAP